MAEHICRDCKNGKTVPPGLFVAASKWREHGRENPDELKGPQRLILLLKEGFYLKEKPRNIVDNVKEFRRCTSDERIAYQAGGSNFTGLLYKYYFGEDCPYWVEKEEE